MQPLCCKNVGQQYAATNGSSTAPADDCRWALLTQLGEEADITVVVLLLSL